MCASRVQEVRCAQKIIHSVPLSVVEDIACLRPELDLHLFGWLEDLVHRRIEVGAMRTIQTVPAVRWLAGSGEGQS